MARGDLGSLALKIGIGFVAYKAAQGGALDKWIPGLSASLKGVANTAAGVAGADAYGNKPNTAGRPIGNCGPASYTGPNGICNPNFWLQADQWKASDPRRGAEGWGRYVEGNENAFRGFLRYANAPDPGDTPPRDW